MRPLIDLGAFVDAEGPVVEEHVRIEVMLYRSGSS